MALKLLTTFREGDATAKLYKDSEWQEYRVKFFVGGAHLSNADYHTDNRTDAQSTALAELRRMTEPKKNPRGRQTYAQMMNAAHEGMDPANLTASQINRMLDALQKRDSALTREMIAAGRGDEKPSETRKKGDALSVALTEIWTRKAALHAEIARRYGPGAPSRLPTRRRNPAKKSPRRVSQITGKPPSKRLKARRAKKHIPGYFPNPRGYKIVHNRLLGGWYAVRGPHHSPIGGPYASKAAGEAAMQAKQAARDARSPRYARAPYQNPLPPEDFIPGAGVPKTRATYPDYRIEARSHKGKRGGWKSIGGFETAKDAEQYARAYANLHGLQVRVVRV